MGGTMVVAIPGDADALLPPIAASQVGAQIADLLFPRLAALTLELNTVDDSGFVPVLAERWERRDSLTIVFHLDPRGRWLDGVPITAGDVVFSHEVYSDPAVGSPYRANLSRVARVSAESEHVAVVRFSSSYPEQLYDVAHYLRVLPRHLLDSVPRASLASSRFAREPIGSGPFRFVRWRPGELIEVEADTAWFRGRPRLDRIVFRVLPDVPAAVTALLAGEADAMEVIPQRDELERVRRDTTVRLVPYPSPFVAGVVFNLRRPQFAERELRRALAMATDRATIVRSLFGEWGEVPPSATSRMQWISHSVVRQLPFDIAAAARVLDSLGWRDGNGDGVRERAGRPLRFTLLVPTTSRLRQEGAVLLQAQWRRIGVDLRVRAVDFPVFDRETRAGNFDAAFFSRTLDPSPASIAQYFGAAGIGGDNIGAWSDPVFDSLVATATSARTRERALPLWRAALERLNDEAAAIHIYAPRNHAAIARRITNVTIRPDYWLATVESWGRATDASSRGR